jgi:Mn-dependent DtxR family transcriptional regulator
VLNLGTPKIRRARLSKSEISHQAEEYLEALYTLTQVDKKVGTTEISRRLGIAPASVTVNAERF